MDSNLKALIDGAATLTKYTTKVWVAMVVIAVIALFPPAAVSGRIPLPFDLAAIPVQWFYFVTSVLLAVFYIAFGSAQTQIARAHMYAHNLVNEAEANVDLSQVKVHPRDLYDVAVTPALNRVGPLAQAYRGRYQFFAEGEAPSGRAILSIGLYIYLKILAFSVYYVLPGLALGHAVRNYMQEATKTPAPLASTVVVAFALGALLAFLPLAWLEGKYIWQVSRRLYRKQAPGGQPSADTSERVVSPGNRDA